MVDRVRRTIARSRFSPAPPRGSDMSPDDRKRLDEALMQMVKSVRKLNDPVLHIIARSKFSRIDD